MRVGIIGGGQLARMLAIASHPLGIAPVVLHPEADCAAAPLAQVVVGDWRDRRSLLRLAERVDLVTCEHEFTAAADLLWLAEQGVVVRPGGHTLALIQDKFRQRQHLAAAGLPVPEHTESNPQSLSFPLVLKTREQGYDGRGTAVIPNAAVLETQRQQWQGQPHYFEAYIPFTQELAVMVARRANGDVVSYPVTTTVQQNYVCDHTLTPAAIATEAAERATTVAIQAVEAVGAVGIVGVELFLTATGEIFINELAPRPHNSGHYTIEGCATSQFEQHLRAICDWPLGSVALRGAVAMVNLLGSEKVPHQPSQTLDGSDTHLHWYGKGYRPKRKLGHITAIAIDLDTAQAHAFAARQRWLSS